MSHPEIGLVLRSNQQAMNAHNRISRWYDWLVSNGELPLTEKQ